MLATLSKEPVDRPGWVYEEKYDGIRLLVFRRSGEVRLYSRNLLERTGEVPAIERALRHLRGGDLILDGELVRGDATRFVAFDCLGRDGVSLVDRPLSERRRALEELLAGAPRDLGIARRLEGTGHDAYARAVRERWEGIVAKDEASRYEPGKRSRAWLKVKLVEQQAFVIGGFTPPAGSRPHLGALLLGLFDEEEHLRYVGKVGSGFGAGSLSSVRARLEPGARATSPFADAPRFRKVTWVEPTVVAQVRFSEWMGQRLRHPVFLSLRDDKPAGECRLDKSG